MDWTWPELSVKEVREWERIVEMAREGRVKIARVFRGAGRNKAEPKAGRVRRLAWGL